MSSLDINTNLDEITLILSKRNHEHIKQLVNFEIDSHNHNKNLASSNEISFTIYKEGNEEIWNDIIDFKYVYYAEEEEYYEITVELTDEKNVSKAVVGTSACEVELSQTYIYGLEVNSDEDIAREEYVNPTLFYKPSNPKESLLHRLLSFVPHYTIKHVDKSLYNIQRTFSIDGNDVYSTLTSTIAEEVGCLFTFDTQDRSISVYDLKTTCNKCGHRGEFSDVCPECGSTNLSYFGEDTTIYIDKDNLAESITYTTDTDSVKNCFRLEGGDDNMTAAIRNCNPNGSNYIYYFSNETRKDMSDELVKKYDEYNTLNEKYQPEYAKLMEDIYECLDKELYYTSGMMPSIENKPTTSTEQAALLTEANLSPLGLSQVISSTSSATVNSALKSYAKVFIKNGYFKVEVNEGSFSYEGIDQDGYSYGYWYGNFKVTDYADEDDTALSSMIKIKVYDNYKTFLEQKIDKMLASEKNQEENIYDVLSIKDLTAFKNALKLYSLNRLTSFYDSIQGAIDILIENGQGEKEGLFYNDLYIPYKNKLTACSNEISERQKTIDGYITTRNSKGKRRNEIQDLLNFKEYLGEDLYNEFCSFKREDLYKNDNYISDGFSNAELFSKAKEFISVAKTELYKSGEQQHTITGTINNFLKMDEFKPIIDKLKLGNFIRVGIDGEVYRLRLISVGTSFSDLSHISLTFSDVTKAKDVIDQAKEILEKSASMSTTYNKVLNQMKTNEETNLVVSNWVNEGLDLTNLKIVNNSINQNVVFTPTGMLARRQDDITGLYDPEQLKLVNSTIAFTTDNWQSVSTALGKIIYIDPFTGEEKTRYGVNAEALVGKFILGENLGIYNDKNTLRVDENGFVMNAITNTGEAIRKMFDLQVNGNSVMSLDTGGNFKLSPTVGFGDDTLKGYIDNATTKSKNVNIVLSNDYCSIPTDSSGLNGNFSSCNTTVQVFYGTEEVTSKVTFTHSATTGITYTFASNKITVSSMSTDVGYVTIGCKYNNITVTKRFQIVKQKQGSKGDQGVGIKGNDGKTSYVHIKYSNDGGKTFTDDNGETVGTYFGQYVDFVKEDSTNVNDYTWSLIKGADGINGIDGKTYHLYLRYSNDAGQTFTSNNGLTVGKYLGTCVTLSTTAPTSVNDYVWAIIKGADGANGKSIGSVVNYYLATNSNTGINTSTSGWTTTVQNVSASKKYLWNYEVIKYTDNTVASTSTPCIIGSYGDKGDQGLQGIAGKDGTNGKTTYFHIKYSAIANPTSSSQISETPNTYIGTYVDYTEADSTDPSKYTWSQFKGSQGAKGEQGIPGTNGTDGKTSYLHIAYANSADGKIGFDVSDSTGKSYIGQYTDFNINDSTDYTKYSWTKIKGETGSAGVGISSIKEHYAKSSSNTTAPTTWQDTVPTLDSTNKYLWNYETITYTNNTTKDTNKRVIGNYAKDGTSITISTKTVEYATSSSGTTAPQSGWSTSVPTVSNGAFLWTRTIVKYSDGTSTTSYSVGYKGTNGTNGTSPKVTKTEVTYVQSTSGTTTPTSGWSSTPPTATAGQYIWTKTVLTYSDGVTSTSYSVSRNGVNGQDGNDAVIITLIADTNTIKVTASNVLQPSNVTFTAKYRIGNGAVQNYNGRFIIQETTNGSTYTTKYTSSANEYTKTWTPSSTSVVAIKCSLYMAGGTSTLLDQQSVTILTDVSQLTQKIVFDKLTNNGTLKGLFMEDNQLYINADYISTGIITGKDGKFTLNMDTGKVVMSDGEFTGTVNATGGKIGAFTLGSYGLSYDQEAYIRMGNTQQLWGRAKFNIYEREDGTGYLTNLLSWSFTASDTSLSAANSRGYISYAALYNKKIICDTFDCGNASQTGALRLFAGDGTTTNYAELANIGSQYKSLTLTSNVANLDTFFNAYRSDTGVMVSMGVGSGGSNHGIYSQKMGSWIVYSDGSKVYAKNQRIDNLFPVGAVYITTTSTNPSNFLGGTWVQFGQGRTLVGQGAGSDGTNSMSFTSMATGGMYKDNKLRAAIGAVNSNTGAIGYIASAAISGKGYTYAVNGTASSNIPSSKVNHSTPVYREDGTDPSLVQPYIVVYFWRRTA